MTQDDMKRMGIRRKKDAEDQPKISQQDASKPNSTAKQVDMATAPKQSVTVQPEKNNTSDPTTQ